MVFLYEGMARHVQDFITICIGSLWVDVPMGPVQASNSAGSLHTTAASPAVVAHDQEVNSSLRKGSPLSCPKPQSGGQEELLPKQG